MKLCDFTVSRRFMLSGLASHLWVSVVMSTDSEIVAVGQAIPDGASKNEVAAILRSLAAKVEEAES
jgi:hypothetical protein